MNLDINNQTPSPGRNRTNAKTMFFLWVGKSCQVFFTHLSRLCRPVTDLQERDGLFYI